MKSYIAVPYQFHVGLFGALFRKLGVTQKLLLIERSGRKFGPRGVCKMYVGIFDLEHVNVIRGHLVHFSENCAATQKLLFVERNGRKVGPQG